MADTITAPAAGIVFATDDIGGVHYPRTKISIGADGAAADLSSSNPMPVSATALPLPAGAATAAKQDEIITAIEGISPGGGSGGDASAANQDEQTALLTSIDAALVAAEYYPATQPVSGTVGISGSVAVTGTFFQATQPVSIANPVAVTGTFWQVTQPISAASLPLPTGASTAANQATAIAAIATIGTRAYGAAATRVAYTGTSAQSAAITGTEVLLHNCGTARCYVTSASNPTATVNDIPIEAGEKFHLRITSGHKIAAIQDSAGGNLNIVPVA